MIYLYESTETDFRYNGVVLPTAYDVVVKCVLNSEYYVTGKHPIDKKGTHKEITENCIIKVHTMDGMQPFRIVTVSKHDLHIEFEAWPLFYADMRTKLVKHFRLSKSDGQTALNAFVNNLLIEPPFTFFSDISRQYRYKIQTLAEEESDPNQLFNALDIFKDMVTTWGGELWVRGYDVRMRDRIGSDTEAILYEKKNISEFVDTTNVQGLVTRAHGKAEWTEDIEVLVPPKDGEDKKETEEHSITVTVDSPLIDEYGGVIFEKQFTNDELRTEKELKDWLKAMFDEGNIDKPTRSIDVGTNIVDDTTVNFGDTLILKYLKHDVDMRIRVVGYEMDGFANRLNRIILGEPQSTSTSSVGNTITDLVNNIVRPVDKKTTIAIQNATKGFQHNINMARNERDITISDNYIEILSLPITVLEATNAAAHMTVVGESTSQRLLDGYFTLDGEVLEAPVKQVMFQGFNTISVNFILTQLQEGFHNLRFYLKSEGNSFFIKQNECTVFITGQGLYAQLGTKLPSAYFADEVKLDVDFEVTDYAYTTSQIPLSRNIEEDVIFNVDFDVTDQATIIFEGINYTTDPPAMPTGVTYTIGINEIKLEWDESSEDFVAGYNVYVDGIKHNNTVIFDTQYIATGLEHGKSYNIKLTAISVWSVESQPLEIVVDIPEQVIDPREQFARVENYPDYNLPTQEKIDEFIDNLYSDNNIFKVILLENAHWYLFTTEGTYIDVDINNKIITSDGAMYSRHATEDNRSRGTSVNWSSQPQNLIVAEEYERQEW